MNDSGQDIRQAVASKYRGIASLCLSDLEQRHRRTLPLTDAEWMLLEELCSATAKLIRSLSASRQFEALPKTRRHGSRVRRKVPHPASRDR